MTPMDITTPPAPKGYKTNPHYKSSTQEQFEMWNQEEPSVLRSISRFILVESTIKKIKEILPEFRDKHSKDQLLEVIRSSLQSNLKVD